MEPCGPQEATEKYIGVTGEKLKNTGAIELVERAIQIKTVL